MNKDDAIPTFPNFDPGLFDLLVAVIWILLGLFVLWSLRKPLKEILTSVSKRIDLGAAVKIWNFELGAIKVAPTDTKSFGNIEAFKDKSREIKRNEIYAKNKNVFISHRLFLSETKGQTYDVLIFLVGHKDSEIQNIKKVEYYLGEFWRHNVYVSSDRNKRYGIVVSAHGAGFLCLAKIYYSSGDVVETWRYIDFEVGVIGSTKGEP